MAGFSAVGPRATKQSCSRPFDCSDLSARVPQQVPCTCPAVVQGLPACIFMGYALERISLGVSAQKHHPPLCFAGLRYVALPTSLRMFYSATDCQHRF